MSITKYDGQFHDGFVRSVIHSGNNIELFLESCVVNPGEILEKHLLSDCNKLKGVLKVRNVQNIVVDDHILSDSFKMQHDYAEILTLEVDENNVYLLIEWDNNPPKPQDRKICEIKIEAEEVCWISNVKSNESQENEKN